jgi:O-succinylbenzoic acid--CoA ligase
MPVCVFTAAREQPRAVAIVQGDELWTYARLAEAVATVVGCLRARGIDGSRGEPLVAVDGHADIPTLVTLHALFAIGVPALLLHPRLTQEERAALIAAARPALVWDPALLRDSVAPAPWPEQSVPDDERPLAIVYTSGTASRPKGVVLSRRALAASAHASAVNLGWAADDRWLLCLSPAHVSGLSIVTRCLLARRAVVVLDGADWSAQRLTRAIARDRVTLVSLVPTQLKKILDLDPRWSPPPSLRAVLLGGAAAGTSLLSAALERGVNVLPTYGMTETCSQVATRPYGAATALDASVGPPLLGIELRVDGTIQVRGPTMFTGYWSERGLEPPRLCNGWYDTGDIGALDARGWLEVHGRLDDLIITGGENVSPLEVEATVEQHPAVAEACVFSVDDDTWGHIVAAAVVPSGSLDLQQLEQWCELRLARHKRPRLWALATDLHRTAAGKLDRRANQGAFAPEVRPLPRATGSPDSGNGMGA